MILIPANSRLKNRKPRVGRGASAPKNIEQRYGRELRTAVDVVFEQRVRELVNQYENGRNITDLLQATDALQAEAANMLQQIAQRAVPDWFSAVDQYAANKFTRSIRDAMGIDATSILNQEIYDSIREGKIYTNVGLIRNLSVEHYQLVRQALLDDYQGLAFPGEAKSLAGRIQDITGITKERASVIARDQTAKLNSDMAEARQADAGIEHYEWRNAGDQSVVGNPGGLYPKVSKKQEQYHGNHWEREGKIYPVGYVHPDGKVGHAILCRCIGLPVFVPAKMNVQTAAVSVLAGAA